MQWLLEIGCRAVAAEVSCPIGRFRIDAAGWLDHCESDSLPTPTPPQPRHRSNDGPSLFDAARPRRRGPAAPRAIVIECKQSRSDFLRNRAEGEALAAQLASLRRRAKRIEETRIKRFEPQLRRVQEGLFETEERWEFAASGIKAYHRLLARIESTERELYGRSKFERLRTLRLADHVFVLCPRGLVHPRELPGGVGLLECPRRLLRAAPAAAGSDLDHPSPPGPPAGHDWRSAAIELRRRRDSERLDCAAPRRLRLLRNIAVAATRDAWRGSTPL